MNKVSTTYLLQCWTTESKWKTYYSGTLEQCHAFKVLAELNPDLTQIIPESSERIMNP